MPSVSSLVRAARLAPAAGIATQPPHTHPAIVGSDIVHEAPRAPAPSVGSTACPAAPSKGSTAFAESPSSQAACEIPLQTRAILSAGGVLSQLSLLLPANAVQGVLLPRGHLAEIAKTCSVQIDLGGSQEEGKTGLTLTGTILANTLATMH